MRGVRLFVVVAALGLALCLLPGGASAARLSSGVHLDDVVPRHQWQPTYTKPAGVTSYASLKELQWVVIHHSDFVDPIGAQGILDYHLEVSRFSDIGYHFVVADDGRVYEGRDLRLLGAHAGQSKDANRAVRHARRHGGDVDKARRKDPDWGAIGVVVDGYFVDDAPPAVQQKALTKLVAQLRRRFGIPADHVVTHREVKQKLVEDRGHTFTGPLKECPGDALQLQVEKTWRSPPKP